MISQNPAVGTPRFYTLSVDEKKNIRLATKKKLGYPLNHSFSIESTVRKIKKKIMRFDRKKWIIRHAYMK